MKHILTTSKPAQKTPSQVLPDGMITGNGDVSVILSGGADRIRLYIGKNDFWKADGRVYTEHRGGLAPLALAEILLPHLAYAEYEASQDMDNANITLSLNVKNLFSQLFVRSAEAAEWRFV